MQPRLQKIDILRALALIGMVIYHFTWDLAFFNYIPPNEPEKIGFLILARIVAASFLFLSGFSLYLAHSEKYRQKAFIKRFIIIVLCAVLVSVASYQFAPDNFIYFGVLHAIALSSVIGLLFLRTPVLINVIAIAICFALPWLHIDISYPAFWWLGLSQNAAPSFDYVPLFPWFGFALAGQISATFFARLSLFDILRKGVKPDFFNKSLQYLGRHSLIFYLLHQPLLIGLIYIFSLVFPPYHHLKTTETEVKSMYQSCVRACSVDEKEINCKQYCSCTINSIEKNGALNEFLKGKTSKDDQKITFSQKECVKKAITLP